MDDNELSCKASALAPLCKLRSLRTLSLEKNRLTAVPPLLGARVLADPVTQPLLDASGVALGSLGVDFGELAAPKNDEF